MNKKTNTLLFMLGATVFNILITIASFFILLIVYFKFIPNAETSIGLGSFVIFFLAIAASFVLYRFILNRVIKRIDMDKYFDPLFSRKHHKH
jgi:hypothetical protein